MTNPASARRAPAPDTYPIRNATRTHRRLARLLPIGTGLAACLLLAAAAAVDGGAAPLVLAIWVVALVVIGVRLSEPKQPAAATGSRIVRRPVLVLAELSGYGELGPSTTLPVVASPEAIAVLDSRPRG